MIYFDHQQGSPEWLECRRAVITGSRAKDARDKSDGLTDQQRKFVADVRAESSTADAAIAAGYKKTPTSDAVVRAIDAGFELVWGSRALSYAMDVAREIVGGKVPSTFVNAYMKAGTFEEPAGRMAYEVRTRTIVDEVGFYCTDDRAFGCSVDGLVGNDGLIEIKTMVSSTTLFTALGGDISEYIDQCNFALWLLGRKWCDLVLWAPDLESIGRQITIVRIDRDEEAIAALEADMLAFQAIVNRYVEILQPKEAA